MFTLLCMVYLLLHGFVANRPYDRTVALQKMMHAGGQVTTATSMVFELLETAEHPDFKTISNIVKAARNDEFKMHDIL
ncbi:hypothetical protein EON65_35450 [archaeon]|nr:MAG: hypothetical protein EON65_35450 [archaeon]